MSQFLISLVVIFLSSILTFADAGMANQSSIDGVLQKQTAKALSAIDILDAYLDELPPEEEWLLMLGDFEPIPGDYCKENLADVTFRKSCIGQLDCICKEYSFGYSIQKYRQANRQLAEKIFERSFPAKPKDAVYNAFLQKMILVWFAGEISGLHLSDQIMAANSLYEKNPQKAQDALGALIDVNETIKKKIESIREEKKKFVEFPGKLDLEKPRLRALAFQPLHFFWGVIAFGYEWKATDSISLHAKLNFLGSALITETYLGYRNKKDFSCFMGFGPKFYVIGEALKTGLYIEPMVEVGYESVTMTPSTREQEIALVPAFLVGFDKVFNFGIQIGVGAGFGVHVAIYEFSPIAERYFVVPKFYGAVGYAW